MPLYLRLLVGCDLCARQRSALVEMDRHFVPERYVLPEGWVSTPDNANFYCGVCMEVIRSEDTPVVGFLRVDEADVIED